MAVSAELRMPVIVPVAMRTLPLRGPPLTLMTCGVAISGHRCCLIMRTATAVACPLRGEGHRRRRNQVCWELLERPLRAIWMYFRTTKGKRVARRSLNYTVLQTNWLRRCMWQGRQCLLGMTTLRYLTTMRLRVFLLTGKMNIRVRRKAVMAKRTTIPWAKT